MDDESYVIEDRENRQRQIEQAEIGETVSIARRVSLQYGFAEGAIQHHNKQVRGVIDQQVHRARRRLKDKKYTVENGSFMTRDGALIIVAVATRVE